MYPILSKRTLAQDIYEMSVRAPRIAHKRQAGQFVIVRVSTHGERIPLTIVGADLRSLAITIVFQVVGESTRELAALEPGDEIPDIVGPLGRPTELGSFHHVICMGGGLGIALIRPIAEALRPSCKRLVGIISARRADLLILEQEIGQLCDELKVATDDGSEGYHGFPTELLKEMLAGGERPDAVYAVGPVRMMAVASEVTRPHAIKTIVSLNPIMLDGTGMCGGCRVSIGGQTRFACVDGPDFDGHQVDFTELTARLRQYTGEPVTRLLPRYESAHSCDRQHTELLEAMVQAGRAAKKALEIPRQPMPDQPASDRIRNFQEVPLGLTPEQAELEARRCLQCKKPTCMDGCPVGINIPAFIKLVAEGKYADACVKIKEDNALPAVCGRVCPQEVQCEVNCILSKKGDPVAIGNLERFAADYEREHDLVRPPVLMPRRGVKVAIVGSGPAGLTTAGELARMGYEAVIFEALHEAGGVSTYGIPEFRLPKEIVRHELEFVKALGVQIQTNVVVGKTVTVQDLFDEGFRAIFIGSGAGLPILAGMPGENLNGIVSANEYLTRVNLMRAYDPGYRTPVMLKRNVAVLGGGNVAMDSARTALRLGAETVTLIYRRSIEECPARIAELHHAEEEGIRIHWLCNAVEALSDDKAWVKGLRCIKMQLGEAGSDGRRRPYPIPGSGFDIPAELVIVAYGNRPHPLIPQTTAGLKVGTHGTIIVEPGSGATSLKGVYAGGDIVTGAATVILAMGAGKDAAKAIDNFLTQGKEGADSAAAVS